MISRLRARNFRALTDADLPLADGVTLVFGSNGSGKSSLAAALELLLEATASGPTSAAPVARS